jgi:hypothetical protein
MIEPGREKAEWEQVVCLLTIARFCAQKSELEAAEHWYADSALEDLLGIPWQRCEALSRSRRGSACVSNACSTM